MAREQQSFALTTNFHAGLGRYLADAQAAGFVDPELKVDMVTGLVLDRLGGQILFAAADTSGSTTVLNDKSYAEDWLTANTKVLIHGFSKGA